MPTRTPRHPRQTEQPAAADTADQAASDSPQLVDEPITPQLPTVRGAAGDPWPRPDNGPVRLRPTS